MAALPFRRRVTREHERRHWRPSAVCPEDPYRVVADMMSELQRDVVDAAMARYKRLYSLEIRPSAPDASITAAKRSASARGTPVASQGHAACRHCLIFARRSPLSRWLLHVPHSVEKGSGRGGRGTLR